MKKLYNKYDSFGPPVSSFDKYSPNEVLNVLKKQMEFCECRGFSFTQSAQTWFSDDGEATEAKIWSDHLTPYHNHDYFEINYVVTGQLAQYINGKPMLMNEGELLIMPPAVYHESFPIGDGYSINILLRENFVKRMESKLAKYSSSNYLSHIMRRNVYMLFTDTEKQGADKLIAEFMDVYDIYPREFSKLLRTNLAEKLMLILTHCSKTEHIFTVRDAGENTPVKAETILNYINENYASITLEELANHFGYSTQQIRRIIKKHTGYSYAQAVQMKRIGVSIELLTKTQLSIKEIASIVGLDSPEYFCRRFKCERGMTPTEFRKAFSTSYFNR